MRMGLQVAGRWAIPVLAGVSAVLVAGVPAHRSPMTADLAPAPHEIRQTAVPAPNEPAVLTVTEPVGPLEPVGQALAPAGMVETAVVAVPPVTPIVAADAADMARFLDRLMLAESGGRDTAKNPRSSALGAFQFIDSTFLEVVRRHFARETASLSPGQILALRTDRAFARRAAEAFTRDNADHLAAHGLATTFANLRLAFFLGPAGAVRVLKAEAASPVISIVGAGVVQANPFMAGMTAGELATWAGRNLAAYGGARIATRDAGDGVPLTTAVPPDAAGASAPVKAPAKPAVAVKCNLALASCRKWLTLAEQQIAKGRQPLRGAPVRIGAKRQGTATR